jgi:hypothetical protein
MPTINAFYTHDKHLQQLSRITDGLKSFVAQELKCGDISLDPSEVSVRLLKAEGSGLLAEIELEFTAHAFDERIEKQDEICLNIRKFLKEELDVAEIRVWLLLPQLGHSWD